MEKNQKAKFEIEVIEEKSKPKISHCFVLV